MQQIGSIIFSLVIAVVWGFATRAIVTNKGYPKEMNHGFAWGFWLGLIGLIVCACKKPFVPDVNVNNGQFAPYNNSNNSDGQFAPYNNSNNSDGQFNPYNNDNNNNNNQV